MAIMTREFGIKEKALELRGSGKSYNEISSLLGVAKSTLSDWFRGSVENFDEVKKANIEKNKLDSSKRLSEFTKERKRILFLKYDQAISEAREEFKKFKNDPLFVAGLMIYASEGDNKTRCHIRISNTDWKLHKIFILFIEKYLLFTREKVSLQLLIYPDLSQEDLEKYWANKLSINRENFYKTQTIIGKSKRRLQFGVCMTIINNTRAKYKLFEWIQLFKDQYAGMV